MSKLPRKTLASTGAPEGDIVSKIVRARGLIAYLGLTFAFSWIPALLMSHLWASEDVPTALRFLVASVIYAVCMGWQPLVAVWIVRRWVDRGEIDDVLATARAPFYVLAAFAPAIIAGIAMALVLMFGTPPFDYAPRSAADALPQTFEVTLMIVAAMCAALSLLWIQALAEEVGWRGYFLTRFMQQLGPLRGLALHGAIWGLWYAPLFLVANGALGRSTLKSLAFIVTCMFLGALLGWLRLASKSVLTTTLANSALTVTAGLPFLLHGEDPGVRGAAYGPAGWIPMSMAVILILTTRYRDAVRVPELANGPRRDVWLLWFQRGEDEERTLH